MSSIIQPVQTQITTKLRLQNGMTVLLRENHNAPLVSWWVLYRVGSRNEPTGRTGASHWVEHMLFKGTERFPAGTLDQTIDRMGGTWNARTSMDYTAFHETLPAAAIDLALQLEADRMINASFDPDDVESERTVIISERQGSENYPSFWLGEEISAAAFRVHGYHHEIIGDMADLNGMSRDDLHNHYKYYYTPSNAIGALVGDFDTADMIAKLETLYGTLPSASAPVRFMRPEPPQAGERRVTVRRPGSAHYLSMNYRVPDMLHPDWIKLYLLDAVFGGPASFGGGSTGTKTTRLYRALVKTEIAASVGAGLNTSIDPYLYSIDVTLRAGRTIEEAEAAILAEIEKLRMGQITQAELDRAIKQARALFAYGGETVTSQAFWLAYFEHVAGSYEWLTQFEERLSAVTLADLQTVAEKYLNPAQSTIGWFIPTTDAQTTGEDDE